MNKEDFRISLYAARVNAGYSRAEVSKITGLSVGTIGKYESGRGEPKASMIQTFCQLYDIGIDQLRFDDVKPINTGAGRRKKEKTDERKDNCKRKQVLGQ